MFRAANGDLLVGEVTWDIDPGGDLRSSRIIFHWRDFVELSDGTIVASTGLLIQLETRQFSATCS